MEKKKVAAITAVLYYMAQEKKIEEIPLISNPWSLYARKSIALSHTIAQNRSVTRHGKYALSSTWR